MPIYEYECEACGHSLDALQKMSDAPLKDCPACGKAALRKRISAPRFRLKGAGWYETDFKQGNRRNIAESGETDSKSTAKSETKESETKDKAKSESKDKTKSDTRDKTTSGDSGSAAPAAKPTAPSTDA